MSRTVSSLVIVIMFLFVQACEVDPDEFDRVLEDEGYTHIQSTGYDAFACSDDDQLSSGFTAVRRMPDGTTRQVSGTVCCGLFFKNCTIRH